MDYRPIKLALPAYADKPGWGKSRAGRFESWRTGLVE
jgi:hypothetical protein